MESVLQQRFFQLLLECSHLNVSESELVEALIVIVPKKT